MSPLARSAATLGMFAIAVAGTFGLAALELPGEAIVQIGFFESMAVLTCALLASRRALRAAAVLAVVGMVAAAVISQAFLGRDVENVGTSLAALLVVLLVLAPWIVAFNATPLPRSSSD